ncbi:cytochrome bc complex cytochrome b subunit [Acaryochloris sp. 'Moss Beach']|uniref:cytochrome b N-terminal domain-containing protein n=1 Tax=Acaryochloris sp. 'Moss Beach' TaxID=2740837 RepID=UPI001F1B196A|nr:cytochrome b N-terminal domain-containing protein [Acaryochloris sp. 'Moss Beach']UJB69515.1 cytochrome bc complex cytochrome b subunit [Acaryochloris sp. 'Moss Beach']
MNEKDLKLAEKTGQFVRRFPDIWQEYQDWLRAIVSSQEKLQQRYSEGLASLIFRWRLLYFGIYMFGVVGRKTVAQIFTQLSRPQQTNDGPIVKQGEIATQSLQINRTYFILQRIATLLAVAELTLCGLAAMTGVMLAFYYQPTALGAHASLHAIAYQIVNGNLILSLHNIAGNGLIVLALVQIVVMFLGRQFMRSWLTAWISGICLALATIGLSWTAIILNWDQVGFWRFKIELNIIGSLPAGSFLREVLAGGSAINTLTLQHMYTLHSYVLAIAALLLSVIHLTAHLFQEKYWAQTALESWHSSEDTSTI